MDQVQLFFSQLDIKKAGMIGVGLAAFYYFLFFNDGQRIEAQIRMTQSEIATKSAQLDKVKKAVADQKKFEAEISQISNYMKEFLQFFPASVDSNEVMTGISKAAENFKITIIDIKPGKESNEFPEYPETVVEFQVEGDFHQIMKFLASMTTVKRALDFSVLKFKSVKTDDDPRVQLEGKVVVYSHNASRGSG
ncbi:MAG: type 4a pilus biogenesis protein PilO [Bdellovibrionales bacterium]|nr:type 4a pilus biogenesis protein PilO [Bdellovibrionales bacterium]